MIDTRQHVHDDLIDRLRPTQLTAVAGLLESMLDPVSHALAMAPLEDEEIGEEEHRAVARSKEWFKRHEGTPFEDVVTEMGFSMEQIRNLQGTRLKRIVFSDDARCGHPRYPATGCHCGARTRACLVGTHADTRSRQTVRIPQR